ncbi:uncharacterized protein LOC111715841 isoform X3 [Eurytemora carolleeae]|uniref:uncharacterized protein LOC111715841 isoform X3 n=1 Tax=Eurytemora carolleeae TaxID=1294199 RepID=UPI000C782438|nr:uncharacterized protein LOC111715841 isoform X3 [Eurytemora carolleeae]|eukprot:XP_023346995.1 uncharacterized protein LOC111715841 isoform X3 [Eurytemora affinis]
MRGIFLLVLLFTAATAAPAASESASQIVRNIVSLFVEPDNEEAPYTVEQTFDEIEKRVYPARKWACTGEQVEQDSDDNGRMFWKLFNYIQVKDNGRKFWKFFNYIQGANTDERKMAMTVPVATSVAINGEEVRVEMFFRSINTY